MYLDNLLWNWLPENLFILDQLDDIFLLCVLCAVCDLCSDLFASIADVWYF